LISKLNFCGISTTDYLAKVSGQAGFLFKERKCRGFFQNHQKKTKDDQTVAGFFTYPSEGSYKLEIGSKLSLKRKALYCLFLMSRLVGTVLAGDLYVYLSNRPYSASAPIL